MTRTQMAPARLGQGADFSPLFRSMIGFDRLANLLDGGAVTNAYPPYNIEKMGDDAYRISMAVAGFTQDDIDITVENGTLSVQGRKADERLEGEDPDNGRIYLHRGIATRAFEQRFSLADHVEVKDASLANGMLTIDLLRVVPERLKPRKIEVKQSMFDKAKEAIAKSNAKPN